MVDDHENEVSFMSTDVLRVGGGSSSEVANTSIDCVLGVVCECRGPEGR